MSRIISKWNFRNYYFCQDKNVDQIENRWEWRKICYRNWTLDHPVALLIEEAASKSIKIFLFLSLIWQMTVGKMMFWYIWRFSVERWSFMIVIMVFTATTQSSQIVCEIAKKFLCLTLSSLIFWNFNEPRTLNKQ